jgi:hypothetical protein
MAITIDPMMHVILVPRADLDLLQSAPEVRKLDLNWFRLQLRALEDNQSYNICMLKTHRHNTEVTLSGLVYARIVEVLAPYTVEFEDGQYAVNCIGANHNLSDVKVANQVSLIVNNAAGLIGNAQIEYSSFGGGVTVDISSSTSGTVFPTGTPQLPVNNFEDALLIASVRGFSTFYIIGDATVDNANNFDGMIFVGESQTKSELDVDSDASVVGCEFYDATIIGTLDGDCKLRNCTIGTLNYVNGVIEQCLLEIGTITLGGGAEAHFLDCWSGVAGTSTPIIDMGGSGQDLSLRNYNGGIRIQNKSGPDPISIDLNCGHIILDSDVTNGDIVIRGIGKLTDNSVGANVNIQDFVNPGTVADAVWDHSDGSNLILEVARVLGLSQENYYLDQTSYTDYNGQKLLTSGRIRTYSDPASVGTANDVLSAYTITSVWTNDELQTYGVVKQ